MSLLLFVHQLFGADNVEADAGSGGATFASDDISSVQYPRIKLIKGADGVNDGDIDDANPYPIELRTPNGDSAMDDTADAVKAVLQAGTAAIGKLAANSGVDIGDVDVLSSALPTGAATEATLDAIKTAVELIDNMISGSEAQVDVVASLPAGTNAIGKLAANDGVDIGDVDVATLPSDTFVAEDGALGKGVLLQVDDGTDRKNVAGDTDGHMQVDVQSSALPAGAATAANQSTANTALAAIQTAVEILDNVVSGNEAQVDVVTSALPTGAATETTLAAVQTAVELIDNAISGSEMQVDIVSGTVTASNAAGDVAHDAADSGNPVKVGGKAVAHDGTEPGTAVAENDRANFTTDRYGRQLVQPVHPNFWSVTANYGSAQTDTELKAAPGAGYALRITDIVFSNGPTAGNMKLTEDGGGGSAADILETMYFAANGGAALHFTTPIPLTANLSLEITSVTVTNHSVTINGYTEAV